MKSGNSRVRWGLSLTEVLVAIFVMGIGMISLLVLFPVGLSNMHWAMRDSRLALSAQTALENAESVQQDPVTLQPYTLRSEPNYAAAALNIPDGLGNALFYWYDGGFPGGTPIQPAYDARNGHSPPVYVDSVGVYAFSGLGVEVDFAASPFPRFGHALGVRKTVLDAHDRIAHNELSSYPRPFLFGIPRVRSSEHLNLTEAVRACTQEDEISFAADGTPADVGGGTLQRQDRFSWAYMCRFPKGEDRSVVDMTIVLYENRNLEGAYTVVQRRNSGEVRYFGNELTNYKVFALGSTEAVIELYDPNGVWTGQNLPAPSVPVPSEIKRDSIILDNTLAMPSFFTYVDPSGTLPPARYYAPFAYDFVNLPRIAIPPRPGYDPPPAGPQLRTGLANGFFYKVIAVGPVETAPNGRFIQRITLDRPALADGLELVLLKGAVEIIEKNTGRTPGR